MTCPLFCELFIALIAKELYSALCFLVLLKNSLNFSSFFSNLFLAAKTYTDFNQNIAFQRSMKRQIFSVCLFYCFFFRLQIYKAIAAIFWQSASSVHRMFQDGFFLSSWVFILAWRILPSQIISSLIDTKKLMTGLKGNLFLKKA